MSRREPIDLPDDEDDAPPRPWWAPERHLLAWFLGLMLVCGVCLVVVGRLTERPADDPPAGGAQAGPAPAVKPTRIAAGETWVSGPVSIGVINASVVGDDAIWISVAVTTTDPKRAIDFKGWRALGAPPGAARLADDVGNAYRMTRLDLVADGLFKSHWAASPEAKGFGLGPGPVHSDRPRVEVLVFDRPVPAATCLDLDLDGSRVGVSGMIRFRVPRSLWEGK
jgi:hypothetical protein